MPSLPWLWSKHQGILWKAKVPGQGNSSPVVWDDRVFVTSMMDRDEPSQLVILCYDSNSGSELWLAECGPAIGKTHSKNSHASATLTTDGQHVYAFFGSRGMFCYDMQGHLQWEKDLGPLEQRWGTAASPILYDRLVIQNCDNEKQSFLIALDKNSGQEVWRTARESNGSWTSPILVQADQDSQHLELIINGTGNSSGAKAS